MTFGHEWSVVSRNATVDIRIRLAGLLLAIGPAMCWANAVPDWSLERKVAESAVVVIAVATEPRARTTKEGYVYAKVRVVRALKGTPEPEMEVMTVGPIAEFDPRCCKKDRTYLLFLAPSTLGAYFVVNGPYGSYEIENSQP